MQTRKPVVAGQFYPGDRDSCLEDIQQCLSERKLGESLPADIAGGIVPHAGWVFSGSVASLVFSAIMQQCERVDTFVLFGAAQGYYGTSAVVYDKGGWLTP